jgi:trimethylamine corrinoid protein
MSEERAGLFAALRRAVLEGEDEEAARLARESLAAGLDPLAVIEGGLVPGIREAGDLWEEGEYFLPELVGAAQAMKAAMELLQPALGAGRGVEAVGRVVIGTVQGDIHDIGKTLVATLLAANGFKVSDEGADVPVERFVERAREIDADLVCASALLTTTMTRQRELVAAVREAGLAAKVMVGGAPVTREWAERIGAEGYADNAVAAVAVARRLVAGDDA